MTNLDDDDEIFGDILEVVQVDYEKEIQESDITQDINKLKERTGDERKSKPVIGRLAKSKLISARSKQLFLGAPSTISTELLKSGDALKIATQEFDERVLPIKIIRTFDDGTYEKWTLKEFKYFPRQ